jgi:23S rRNA pseudouridine1911/1915/1917 synthase
MDLDVLYEDDHCLVINKPAGLLVHPTMPGQTGTLGNAVASYYECTGQAVAVKHIHRLDEWTSGPVLYAKHELAQLKLDEAMRAKTIDRIYVTLAEGTFKVNRGTLDYPIGRDRHHKQRRRVSPTGDTAVTHFEVVEQYETIALVRLKLDTGRTHQIRVHLSHIGHPIVGDTLYGGSTSTMHRQALHGESLSFAHPITNERMTVLCPWPQDITETLARLAITK